MWEQTMILTILITAMVIKIYNNGRICVTEQFYDRAYLWTKCVLVMYLIDLILLAFFDFPLPLLHECTTGGAIVSLLVMAVAIIDMMCCLDNWHTSRREEPEEHFSRVIGIGVCIFWIVFEVMGLLLKMSC